MSDIFIAYAHEDEDRIAALARALAKEGWSVFWDQTIPTGLTWHTYIGKALKEARCVVVGWSEDSIHSDWVLEEAGHARERKVLIPILLDAVSPPLGFGRLQALDLADWSGDANASAFRQLVEDMERLLGAPPGLRPGPEGKASTEAEKERLEAVAGEKGRKQEARRAADQAERERAAAANREAGERDHEGVESSPPKVALGQRLAALFEAYRYVLYVLLLVAVGSYFVWRPPRVGPSADGAVQEVGGSDQPRSGVSETQLNQPAVEETTTPGVATARVVVRSNVSGDRTYLDGLLQGPTPSELEVQPGVHRVEVRKEGCETAGQSLDLRAGDERTLRLELDCTGEAPVVVEEVTQEEPEALLGRPMRPNPRILIAGGEFMMGSRTNEGRNNQRPRHRVRVSSFWLQRFEVTNDQYRRFNPGHEFSGQADHPVVNVTWDEARDYAKWLGGRLPTEAQWEFAARGTEGRQYPWGKEAPDCKRARLFGCPDGPSTVGSHPRGATPDGVEDLAGNVWEWCSDWYSPEYPAGNQTNPVGPNAGEKGKRVVRGGSFFDESELMRAAYRDGVLAAERNVGQGFRVVFDKPKD